jgi:hypothetical protein
MSDAALKELIRWGGLLSNCAYSLKGRDILDDDARASLKKCQAGWDDALSQLRAARKSVAEDCDYEAGLVKAAGYALLASRRLRSALQDAVKANDVIEANLRCSLPAASGSQPGEPRATPEGPTSEVDSLRSQIADAIAALQPWEPEDEAVDLSERIEAARDILTRESAAPPLPLTDETEVPK